MPDSLDFKGYREFIETMMSLFGYKPIRYGASFLKKQSFGDSKIRMYRKSENTYFDNIPMNEFSSFYFAGTNEKKSRIANFYIKLSYHSEINKFYTAVVFEKNNCDMETLVEQVDIFKRMMQKISTIKILAADRMDSDKDVYSFALGIGHEKRNEYANEIAYSISRCITTHRKLPYLFVYGYYEKEIFDINNIPEHVDIEEQDGYVALTLPRCFGKELNRYPTFPEWKYFYDVLKASGELIVTDKLETMIERIVSTGGWSA